MSKETYEQREKRLNKNRETEMILQGFRQHAKITGEDAKAFDQVLKKQKYSWRELARQRAGKNKLKN